MDDQYESRLRFEIATIEQAAEVTALVNSAFRSEPTSQTWLHDSQEKRIDVLPLEATQDIIKSSDSFFLIGTIKDNQDIVASCLVRKPSTPPAPHMSNGAAWFGLLAVRTEYHGRGYGQATLQEAEHFVRSSWGVKRLEMDYVNTRVQLGAWYERCGYSATGKRREFPYGDKGREIFADGLELLVIGKNLRMDEDL
ncbi:acyl-CoA N-acyltransferase, partial [Aureobasidium melanogenum]|uniref:Acyl-CoA N-acyltransferase n=1 Tax=Aureobasidium melanogenum (strain CBS 110374) TaxID=1043003 RepID=A0A074VL66_AURM1